MTSGERVVSGVSAATEARVAREEGAESGESVVS